MYAILSPTDSYQEFLLISHKTAQAISCGRLTTSKIGM